MKSSITPHLPRRHFGSYGQLPMPFFNPLNQDFSQLSFGCTTCAVPSRAGAVDARTALCFFSLGKFLRKCFPNDVFTPNHCAGKSLDFYLFYDLFTLTGWFLSLCVIFQAIRFNRNYQDIVTLLLNYHGFSFLFCFVFAKMSCSLKLLMILEYKEVKQWK